MSYYNGDDKEPNNIFINFTQGVVIAVVIIWIVTQLTACTSTIQAVHTDEFNSGCAVINAQAQLGYFNQEGTAQACKLICSKELPKNMIYEYTNGYCKVKVGTK